MKTKKSNHSNKNKISKKLKEADKELLEDLIRGLEDIKNGRIRQVL